MITIKPKNINYVDWEKNLLLLFHQLEGIATLQQIYDLIEKHQDSFQLKPEHFKPQYGVPAYKNQVRAHISNLVKSHDLRWIGTGRYELTEKGLKRIKLSHRP